MQVSDEEQPVGQGRGWMRHHGSRRCVSYWLLGSFQAGMLMLLAISASRNFQISHGAECPENLYGIHFANAAPLSHAVGVESVQ